MDSLANSYTNLSHFSFYSHFHHVTFTGGKKRVYICADYFRPRW